MTLQTKKLTYQEYLAGPVIKARYDIIDGEMIMSAKPTLRIEVAFHGDLSVCYRA